MMKIVCKKLLRSINRRYIFSRFHHIFTSDVVYLFDCIVCGFQYVGCTSTLFKASFHWVTLVAQMSDCPSDIRSEFESFLLQLVSPSLSSSTHLNY